MLALVLACAAPRSSLVDGRLAPCPSSPNCVTSEPGADRLHAVQPLPLGDPGTVQERILAVVAAVPRTEVLEARDGYVHAGFTTAILRFTDDVEFRVDAEGGVVHVRSASRVGYGDLGVNRRRIAAIADRWE